MIMQSNFLSTFWQTQLQRIENETHDFKTFQLPIARIKKVMKTEEEAQHMVVTVKLDD